MSTKVYTGIRQCLTLAPARKKGGRRPTAQDLGIVENAAVVVKDDVIAWVGPQTQLPQPYTQVSAHDTAGAIWLPALVECHTHLVYAGERIGEFAARCEGRTYQQIAAAGGGILSTVRATRDAAPQSLIDHALTNILPFAQGGVQCIEIKSGYGLTLESEIKMLECIEQLKSSAPVEVVATFLPAHAVPPEYAGRADEFVEVLCRHWIPEITKRKLAAFFDVFVEAGYFSAAQARKMALVAHDHGLKVKLHVDQFTDQGGAALAAELGATSCDHLEQVSTQGITRLADSDTTAVLAPGASLFTRTPYPPARALIDAGVRVALTTDFNPGTCPSRNLALMMTLGCTQMQMTVSEAIVATTLNAAFALGVEDRYGTIEAGRPFKIWSVDAPRYEAVVYRFGEIPDGAHLLPRKR